MPRKLSAFIAAVIGLAVVATWQVQALGGSLDAAALRAAACFAVIGLIAQLSTFRLPSSAAGSIAFVPYLAASLVAPVWVTVAIVAGCVGIAEVVRRPAPVKALFNVAQHALCTALAIAAYRQLGGVALREDSAVPLLAFASLTTVFLFVNYLAVSTVVGLSQRRSLLTVWRSNTMRTLAFDVVALPLVYSFLWIYWQVDLPGLFLAAAMIIGGRQLYAANLQLAQANEDLLQVMVAAIELRDPYTSGHSQRVAEYSKTIARAIGLATREVERVGVAALLHDVGKIDQRFADILQKPGRLTDEERAIIEQHSVRSAELVSMVSGLSDIVAPVRHHHERWDGGGYPDGLVGDAIPLAARIITFADTIDAMTSDRPYRPALGPSEVRRELLKHRGRQFDPQICDRLLSSALFDELFAQRAALAGQGTVAPSTLAVSPVASSAPVAPASVAAAPVAATPVAAA